MKAANPEHWENLVDGCWNHLSAFEELATDAYDDLNFGPELSFEGSRILDQISLVRNLITTIEHLLPTPEDFTGEIFADED